MPKTPVPSTTQAEKPVTPRGGLRLGEVWPDPLHLHRCYFLPLEPPLAPVVRKGRGFMRPEPCEWKLPGGLLLAGDAGQRLAPGGAGDAGTLACPGNSTAGSRDNTSPSTWEAPRLISRGHAGKLGPGRGGKCGTGANRRSWGRSWNVRSALGCAWNSPCFLREDNNALSP